MMETLANFSSFVAERCHDYVNCTTDEYVPGWSEIFCVPEAIKQVRLLAVVREGYKKIFKISLIFPGGGRVLPKIWQILDLFFEVSISVLIHPEMLRKFFLEGAIPDF